jgi:hypothetical protein
MTNGRAVCVFARSCVRACVLACVRTQASRVEMTASVVCTESSVT